MRALRQLRALSRPRSVRARSAVLAAAVTAVALVVGVAVLVSVFARQLQTNLDQGLQGQVQDRVQLLNGGSDPLELTTATQEEAMVWIGSPDGVATSMGGELVPLENPVPPALDQVVTITLLVSEEHADEDDSGSESGSDGGSESETELAELRMASATTSDGSLVVIAAAETEQLDKTVNQLWSLFFAGIPVLVAVVGGLTWWTTGLALHPVERIRRRSAEVSGARPAERVPVPDSGDEIEALALTMNDMLDRLESHQRKLTQFTSDASHELKSPVANIRAIAETADLDDQRWPGLQATLVSETERLRDLVENLLFLASHSEGTSARPTAEFHLDDVLFDEAELVTATGRVSVDIAGVSPAPIRGTRSDVARLVRNLLDNAARHATSLVTIECQETPQHIMLSVSDDGPGIPAEDRERIFERFTRLDSARDRERGGTGLGLSIVRTVADDHGATVNVADTPGGGATITVLFPSPADREAVESSSPGLG